MELEQQPPVAGAYAGEFRSDRQLERAIPLCDDLWRRCARGRLLDPRRRRVVQIAELRLHVERRRVRPRELDQSLEDSHGVSHGAYRTVRRRLGWYTRRRWGVGR